MEHTIDRPVIVPAFDKRGGVIPVIVQDVFSHEVLILAYTNREAWELMLATGKLTLFSTSKKKIWVKGEESGESFRVVAIRIDCDGDAMIYTVASVNPEVVACHTGARSCFYRNLLAPETPLYPSPTAGTKEKLGTETLKVHKDLFPGG